MYAGLSKQWNFGSQDTIWKLSPVSFSYRPCGLDAFILTHMQAGRSLLICPISSTGPETSNTKLCNAGNALICAAVTSHIWVGTEHPKRDYCDWETEFVTIFNSEKSKAKHQSLKSCSLSVTPWTAALQTPLSKGFSRQESWSGLPFSSPGELPDPGIKPGSLAL